MNCTEIAKENTSCCDTGGSCSSPKTNLAKFTQMIPQEKNLSPEWLQSLYERGAPEVYSGDDLKYIGMPVSGICTGQVYLSGDGRLWHWDVFKAYGGSGELIDPRGYHYANPVEVKSPLDQGFALRIQQGEHTQVRRLDASGFSDVEFEGRYPIGYVSYKDTGCPVAVELQAFSPFTPMDDDNSGLPATVMAYRLKNTSDKPVSVTLAGWLENKVCRYDEETASGVRHNTVADSGSAVRLSCYADSESDQDLSELDGFGNMTLSLLTRDYGHSGCAHLRGDTGYDAIVETVFAELLPEVNQDESRQPFGTKTVGSIGCELTLQPGEEKEVCFAVAWYFPAYCGGYVFHSTLEDIPDIESYRRYYSTQFTSSEAVTEYVAENYTALAGNTRLWVSTWYDSTLPYWLLNRTFINTSTLATQTCHRFDNGRFYAWEGVDCCPGTCQHVWHYAQAVARLFPQLERSVRKDIDYGIAFANDGSIGYRAEASDHSEGVNMKSENNSDAFFAADGQLGTIIRVYREHSISPDSEFLTSIWPKVKKSLEFMITLDPTGQGLLNAPQFNTLDVTWHGKIPWISSLYLAALAAGKAMAGEMEDKDFAQTCDRLLQEGQKRIVDELFNGEYFIHQPNSEYPESMDLTEGCYIDQVFGQGYAIQLGLERVVPRDQAVSALKALWKYNYAPDVGPYRENFKEVEGGRWYAMPGEGGLLMCTWPREDCNRAEFEQTLLGLDVTSEGYLNECMTGFEYQVASHMIAEGLIEEGLAITRTIHDRYHPSKRNPWNEVECSDHYSRAMASYGVFLNLCGFTYHGPKGQIGFNPRLTPENFRAPFTVSLGWGTFAQTIVDGQHNASIRLSYGELQLSQVTLTTDNGSDIDDVYVSLNQEPLTIEYTHASSELSVSLDSNIRLCANDCVDIHIQYKK
ncbi:GH116 family glycosyl hydrolase [Porticoccus sp. GXU_MW_L64]